MHKTLRKANARLTKREGRTMAITPRHNLNFIHHLVKLYSEKGSYLEEQQLHLNVGLNKIAETVGLKRCKNHSPSNPRNCKRRTKL